jgi:hypothetical protein
MIVWKIHIYYLIFNIRRLFVGAALDSITPTNLIFTIQHRPVALWMPSEALQY